MAADLLLLIEQTEETTAIQKIAPAQLAATPPGSYMAQMAVIKWSNKWREAGKIGAQKPTWRRPPDVNIEIYFEGGWWCW